LIDNMLFKNIYLTDGTCVFKKKSYTKNTCYVFDLKNSKHWNLKKTIKKESIVRLFKDRFLKRK